MSFKILPMFKPHAEKALSYLGVGQALIGVSVLAFSVSILIKAVSIV